MLDRHFDDDHPLARAFRAHGVSVDRPTAFEATKAFYRAGASDWTRALS